MSTFIGKSRGSKLYEEKELTVLIDKLVQHARNNCCINREDADDMRETLECRGYYVCGYGDNQYTIEENNKKK